MKYYQVLLSMLVCQSLCISFHYGVFVETISYKFFQTITFCGLDFYCSADYICLNLWVKPTSNRQVDSIWLYSLLKIAVKSSSYHNYLSIMLLQQQYLFYINSCTSLSRLTPFEILLWHMWLIWLMINLIIFRID